MKKALFAVFLILALTLTAFAAPVSAKIPTSSQYNRVALVPNQTFDQSYEGEMSQGVLPTSDVAFVNFTFTNLPWANVTAGNLTNFDIVVLCIDYFAPQPLLTPQQASDLNAWVSAGGKLIIYDSEMPPQNYSWLIYPFNTSNVGAAGSSSGFLLFKEENTLGSNNPANTFYYINISVDYIFNDWEDAIGDCNLFTTYDPNWCGDILANRSIVGAGWQQSWVHAYARYGSGLMIYNGFDLDYLYYPSNDIPGPNNMNALARIWLLELAQPWATDYNLPCGNPVVEKEEVPTVGGTVIDPMSALIQPTIVVIYFLMALIAGTLAVVIALYRKNASQIVQ